MQFDTLTEFCTPWSHTRGGRGRRDGDLSAAISSWTVGVNFQISPLDDPWWGGQGYTSSLRGLSVVLLQLWPSQTGRLPLRVFFSSGYLHRCLLSDCVWLTLVCVCVRVSCAEAKHLVVIRWTRGRRSCSVSVENRGCRFLVASGVMRVVGFK